ncbi:MAG: hypothetical protein ACLVL7_01995 [Anaerotruncus massiliensis (ex Togo et al. 2019)]
MNHTAETDPVVDLVVVSSPPTTQGPVRDGRGQRELRHGRL